jgi:threonine synthase
MGNDTCYINAIIPYLGRGVNSQTHFPFSDDCVIIGLMIENNAFVCATCGKRHSLDTRDWRCGCGGLFELESWPPFDARQIDVGDHSLWRYRALLPLDPAWEPVTLGEGSTPLLPVEWHGRRLCLKLEFMTPSGSFKDRGAAVLVTALRGLGIGRVVEDSSGNAGASLAAYAARAGIDCEVCVPASASGPKLAQMAAHGTEVIEIKGKREYAALAAWAAAAHGAYYASHVYNPYFLAGTETVAYELWEQLGHRPPAAVIVPTGNGTLFLGLYRGFQRLYQAGLIASLPRLFAVQAAACAPIYRAFRDGAAEPEMATPEQTAASGIAIARPMRGGQILAAVRATNGAVVQVTEDEIEVAYTQLARGGFYVEKTAAAGIAALRAVQDTLAAEDVVVVPLTGHGLKTCPPA